MLTGTAGGTWNQGQDVPTVTGSRPQWSLWLEPSFIYFIRDRIGIGGYVGYESKHGDFVVQGIRYSENHISVGVSGSFELVASGHWGLFLNTSFGYAWTGRTNKFSQSSLVADQFSGFDGQFQDTDRRIAFGLRLPLTYHVSSSLGISLGPDLLYETVVYTGPGRPDAGRRVRLGASSWVAYSF